MRVSVIFVILTLCVVVVRGWVAVLQPIAVSIGAAIAALNLDADLISNLQLTSLTNLFTNKIVSEKEVNKDKEIKWINAMLDEWQANVDALGDRATDEDHDHLAKMRRY